MKSIVVDRARVAYAEGPDVLYVSFGPYDLTCLDHEEELDGGVFLQYAWPSGDLAGMEVWGFSKQYGSLPVTFDLGNLVVHVPEPSMTLA